MDTRSPPCLSITIVLYNSDTNLLQRTLQSLDTAACRARDAGVLSQLQLSLVDNDSDDAYQGQLRDVEAHWREHTGWPVTLQFRPANEGFGAANNHALGRVSSDFHLILNPDVELAEDALVNGLGNLLQQPDWVLSSPHVSADSGEQEFLCKQYPSVWVLFLRGFAPAFLRNWFQQQLVEYEMRPECASGTRCEVPLASGCFMLTRTAALKAVNGFDPRFFLYFEDFDLSIRLASQGKLVFDPSVRIIHHGGYAAGKGLQHIQMFARSARRFFGVHGWRWI
jgi:GT2 family glycosyltransferase